MTAVLPLSHCPAASLCCLSLVTAGHAEHKVLPAGVQSATSTSACCSAAEVLFKKHVGDKRATGLCSFHPHLTTPAHLSGLQCAPTKTECLETSTTPRNI